MVSLSIFRKISDFEWEIPKTYRQDMRVPVRIFATRRLLEKSLDDKSIDQAVNAATLPGLVGQVLVMPDMHQGYGFPIGGVAATRYPDGVISPGGIGYDINCGVRLLASSIQFVEAEAHLEGLVAALDDLCPSGVGTKGAIELKYYRTGPGLPARSALGVEKRAGNGRRSSPHGGKWLPGRRRPWKGQP